MRRGWAHIGLLAALVVGCSSSASASIESIANGRWICTASNAGDGKDQFEAATTVTEKGHTFDLTIIEAGTPGPRISGTWKLNGTKLTVDATSGGGAQKQLTYSPVRKNTPAIIVQSSNGTEGKFIITWHGDNRVEFTQTASFGRASTPGGQSDAWHADCAKA